MTALASTVSPGWLALREPADARARSAELVALVAPLVRAAPSLVVHDLGGGSGSMGRWLAPRLAGPQRWVVHDRDARLLAHAAADPPAAAADGCAVTVETRHDDLSRIHLEDVHDADLVTASALLDLLTADELHRLARTCVAAGCPVLLALTVVGRVELSPAEPLDDVVAGAFDAHQRRRSGGRGLLGPGAADAAADAFTGLGAGVTRRPSPWRLDAADAALTEEWLLGWVGAAVEHRPALAVAAESYLRTRLDQAREGLLHVTVHHADLLAVPR